MKAVIADALSLVWLACWSSHVPVLSIGGTIGYTKLKARTVCIDMATQRIHGGQVNTTPGTQSGISTISLSADAMHVLQVWRVEQTEQRLRMGADWAAGDHVFSGARGRPLSANTVQDCLPRECNRLALPRMTPHSLRHLHASLLISEGLPITAVSKRLGMLMQRSQ